MRALPWHFESSASIGGTASAVFDYLDDHARLASHMSKSSWRMGGGRMQIVTDAGKGRSAGSRMTLSGRVLGWRLSVDEVVTERDPPHRKAWETTGIPKLLVIGAYRMGFEIADQGNACTVRGFIDYALPDGTWTGMAGRLLGGYYARWCIERMIGDAARHFGAVPASAALAAR